MKSLNQKTLSKLLSKAIKIASESFDGIFDKGGKPYILHCLWVMDKVRHLGYEYMIVAVLHDLLEDTDWTKERLLAEGFTERIVFSLILLNFKTTNNYIGRIKEISLNCDIATQVKLRDLEHNSKITRLKSDTLSEKDIERTVKYLKSYKLLEPYRR